MSLKRDDLLSIPHIICFVNCFFHLFLFFLQHIKKAAYDIISNVIYTISYYTRLFLYERKELL